MLYPVVPSGSTSTYLIRSSGRDRHMLLSLAAKALASLNDNRLIPTDGMKTFDDVHDAYFHQDRLMAMQLSGAALALMLVTAFGLGGLSSFWVEQRRRSIGIRRSLGASAASIRHYFQIENAIIVSVGLVLGVFVSYGLGLALFQRYNEQLFDVRWLLASAAVIASTGQFAVLGPSIRASLVSPASVLTSN